MADGYSLFEMNPNVDICIKSIMGWFDFAVSRASSCQERYRCIFGGIVLLNIVLNDTLSGTYISSIGI